MSFKRRGDSARADPRVDSQESNDRRRGASRADATDLTGKRHGSVSVPAPGICVTNVISWPARGSPGAQLRRQERVGRLIGRQVR